MGYYIEVPMIKLKANQLSHLHGGQILSSPPINFGDIPSDKLLICVLDNGPFEAAAIAYSEKEFQYFRSPDSRPKVWLLMDKEKVLELQPKVAEVL